MKLFKSLVEKYSGVDETFHRMRLTRLYLQFLVVFFFNFLVIPLNVFYERHTCDIVEGKNPTQF